VHACSLHPVIAPGACLCDSPLLKLLNRGLATLLAHRTMVHDASGAIIAAQANASNGPASAQAQASTSSGTSSVVASATPASGPGASTGVLFRDVRVFDGIGPHLSGPAQVLVQGNQITRIATGDVSPEPGVLVVDGQGRTLMPGLIDAHAHVMFAGAPLQELLMGDMSYINLLAASVCEEMLNRGFTTIRDMQGPVWGLKRAIDTGLTPGPRLYPSGAMITQTSGHGDFRLMQELPRDPAAPLTYAEVVGAAVIADGVDAVLRAVREQLMRGASQIKLAGGGGVSSNHDPLDVTQYNEDELRAAVGAAEDWNTYAAIHVYTPRSIERAVNAGVRSIEHGHLADEASAKLMAERDTWWSLQPFTAEFPIKFAPGSDNQRKLEEVIAGTDTAYELARRYNVKTAWGTDLLFNRSALPFQNTAVVNMTRWYTPSEVLKMVTSDNAALLGMSGPRNPYPGALGVVREGALADVLLVDGDPTEDLSVLGDPASNILMVMKDGIVYKQTRAVTAAHA
jgi:imidazolonepropionase-like amidohydrolase